MKGGAAARIPGVPRAANACGRSSPVPVHHENNDSNMRGPVVGRSSPNEARSASAALQRPPSPPGGAAARLPWPMQRHGAWVVRRCSPARPHPGSHPPCSLQSGWPSAPASPLLRSSSRRHVVCTNGAASASAGCGTSSQKRIRRTRRLTAWQNRRRSHLARSRIGAIQVRTLRRTHRGAERGLPCPRGRKSGAAALVARGTGRPCAES